MTSFVKRVVAVALAVFTGTSAVAQDQSRVVAVNYPLQYFAERLLGDRAQVDFLVPQDVDPSFWRPSVADISAVQSADLILLNGAGFATWVDRVSLPRSKLVNTSAAISDQFIRTESITHSHGEGNEHSHEGMASYTWLDPALAIAQSEAIAAAISKRGLAPAEDVDARLQALRADLEALDEDARTALSELQDVAIITTHPRYQYLARAYGLEIHALEWEGGAMPNAAELDDLKALVTEHDARLLIWEAEPPQAALQTVGDLGLASVTFSPMAHRVGEDTFIDSFKASLAEVSEAAGKAKSN